MWEVGSRHRRPQTRADVPAGATHPVVTHPAGTPPVIDGRPDVWGLEVARHFLARPGKRDGNGGRPCDPESLGFEITDDLETLIVQPGQDDAVEAEFHRRRT